MASRRDMLLGAACLAGSGIAFAMAPRRYVSLMPRVPLEQITPATVATWTSRDVTNLVAPKIEGSLESRLYDQQLQRIYTDSTSGAELMMLLAHGDTQSNELQLHRPEVCYPAFGFEISSSRINPLRLAANAALPVRSLVANAPSRRETIVYWTRLGEFLPTSEGEQRLDRAKTALRGVVSDGMLARFSMVEADTAGAVQSIETFIVAFLDAVTSSQRAAFVGTSLAQAMARAG
jgi:EpsI family protein